MFEQITYITKGEVLSTLAQKKACFRSKPNAEMRFSDEVFEYLLERFATNTVTKHFDLLLNHLSVLQASKLIKALEEKQTLLSLELRGSKFLYTKEIAELLRVNTHLKKISFYCDNSGAIEIAEALKVNTSLEELDLSCSRIGDEGAKVLAGALAKNKSLRKLNLSYNNDITKAALSHFCRAFWSNETLEEFFIYNKNISLFYNVVDYLRSPECKYYKPDDDSITTITETSPLAENASASTEEKQDDDGVNQRQSGDNPSSSEQQTRDSAFDFSTLEEALHSIGNNPAGTPDEIVPLEPMGENSGL